MHGPWRGGKSDIPGEEEVMNVMKTLYRATDHVAKELGDSHSGYVEKASEILLNMIGERGSAPSVEE